MSTSSKHYKFVNSKTGNTIYYHSIHDEMDAEKIKEELDKVRNKVATLNGVFMETIYWEEIQSSEQ